MSLCPLVQLTPEFSVDPEDVSEVTVNPQANNVTVRLNNTAGSYYVIHTDYNKSVYETRDRIVRLIDGARAQGLRAQSNDIVRATLADFQAQFNKMLRGSLPVDQDAPHVYRTMDNKVCSACGRLKDHHLHALTEPKP